MKPKDFVNSLRALRFVDVFNPYSERCAMHDVADAPCRRAHALTRVLEAAASTEINALWIGRDLGHKGGRRTGLALTDDVHLGTHACRWNVSVQRPTNGAMVSERTASVIWRMLSFITAPVFLWNVFPFHPHLPNDPFSNRSHKTKEGDIGKNILEELVLMLRPRRIIAIGNDAANAVVNLACRTEVVNVRHPSYGGQRDFISQIQTAYGFPVDDNNIHRQKRIEKDQLSLIEPEIHKACE